MTASDFAPVALGLASAALWGAGDFWGGWTTKRQSVYSVVVSSQIIGLLLFIALAVASGEPWPAPSDIVSSVLGGLAGATGILALYRALAEGRMGVAAPVSAVVAAVLPVPVSYLLDGAPKVGQLIGFGLALIAVWFISRAETTRARWRELTLPFIAGAGFGIFFIFIGQVSDRAVWWPLALMRSISLSTLFIAATVQRQPRLVGGPLLAAGCARGCIGSGR